MQPDMPLPPTTPPKPQGIILEGADPRETPVTPPLQEPPSPPIIPPVESKKRLKNTFRSRNKIRETFQQEPERIAQDRTSELTIKMLANLAIQLAIKSRNPASQKEPIRQAEQGYMSRLWNRYTKRALGV